MKKIGSGSMAVMRHRRKNHRFYILMIVIIIIGIVLIPKCLYFLTTSKTERDLKKLSYSNEVISLIIENKIDKYLINNNVYSKTLEVALTKGQYDDDLLEEYIYFPYKNYNDYITQLNGLLEQGYKRDDVEKIFKFLDKDDINVIINKDKVITDIASYINNEYFNIDNLDRYVNYKNKNSSYDYNEVISRVNMFLDYSYYEHDIPINNKDDILIIVNKYYTLGDYTPKNLVKIDSVYADQWDRFVLPIVKENFEKMASDMKKIGLSIRATSAYRSYDTQVSLYNEDVASGGKTYADTYTARAGHSEHQTGLAIDVKKGTNYSSFEGTEEYQWMIKNAHKYGFILRYPKDKTNITGYGFESWHFRYVGNETAKYIYEHNITLDEYYAIFIANKKD
jgi:D-alanyl-D-alanine carboxypeptidase